jgi:hypothetical protein
MIEEVMLDRAILDALDGYDTDFSADDWERMPVEELSQEVLALL